MAAVMSLEQGFQYPLQRSVDMLLSELRTHKFEERKSAAARMAMTCDTWAFGDGVQNAFVQDWHVLTLIVGLSVERTHGIFVEN